MRHEETAGGPRARRNPAIRESKVGPSSRSPAFLYRCRRAGVGPWTGRSGRGAPNRQVSGPRTPEPRTWKHAGHKGGGGGGGRRVENRDGRETSLRTRPRSSGPGAARVKVVVPTVDLFLSERGDGRPHIRPKNRPPTQQFPQTPRLTACPLLLSFSGLQAPKPETPPLGPSE